jgi:hypothetical protein
MGDVLVPGSSVDTHEASISGSRLHSTAAGQQEDWQRACSARALLRCGVRVHELEDMHDVIIAWPDRAAA